MMLAKRLDKQFSEVVTIIRQARWNAVKNVNAELVKLYWNIGEYISGKIATSEWGDSVVDQLADYIQNWHPEFKGFTRRGLYRMRQFYEVYRTNEFVSTLLTQINWSCHLHILSKTKTAEEKEFYLRLAAKERYSVRELERQIDSACYERTMISSKKMPPLVKAAGKDIAEVFKDTYILDFLDLPESYNEKDLRRNIVSNLKDFILEFGKDFAFMGQEYSIQVGGKDYFIDLLFFHRGLKCLVMIELKITDFKPEYLGKTSFYLEALDRQIKKEDENPSVGIILCKSKDDEVVEYAMSRHLSPTLVAEYKTKLIPRKILQKKLHELFLLQDNKESDENE